MDAYSRKLRKFAQETVCPLAGIDSLSVNHDDAKALSLHQIVMQCIETEVTSATTLFAKCFAENPKFYASDFQDVPRKAWAAFALRLLEAAQYLDAAEFQAYASKTEEEILVEALVQRFDKEFARVSDTGM